MAKRKSNPTLVRQLDMFGDWAVQLPPSVARNILPDIQPEAAPLEIPVEAANACYRPTTGTTILRLPANDIPELLPPTKHNRRGSPSLIERDLVQHGRALGDLDARALLRPPELSQMLGLTLSTLAKLRCSGKGPPFYKLTNQTVGYNQDDVLEWLSKRRRVSTWSQSG